MLDNAKEKADEANRAMIQQAIDLYIVNEGQAPTSLDDLKTEKYLRGDIP